MKWQKKIKILIDLYLKAELRFGIKTLAKRLAVRTGTIQRWKLLNNVPKHYMFDLYEILDMNLDYEKFDYKQKDQFFTSTLSSEGL